MRVIAGEAKGHKLKGTAKKTTRAITDRIKESIFGILGDISGKRVLDLFAGTGSLGIEALSRGAGEVIFVDRDRNCAKLIKENLSLFTENLQATVYTSDVKNGLKRLGRSGDKFDLVFVDPPFGSSVGATCPPDGRRGLLAQTLKDIEKFKLVSEEGLVIARHHNKQELSEKVDELHLNRRKKYGEDIVCFYEQG